MQDLTTERYLRNNNSVYSLVILAAKRTVVLNRGEKSLLPEVENEKPIMVALDEISAGKIALAPPKEEEDTNIEND